MKKHDYAREPSTRGKFFELFVKIPWLQEFRENEEKKERGKKGKNASRIVLKFINVGPVYAFIAHIICIYLTVTIESYSACMLLFVTRLKCQIFIQRRLWG